MKNDPRSCDRNFYNCVMKPEKKNSGLQRGLNPWPREYRCDALPTELWSHWRWEQVNCGFICSRERYVNEWCIWNKSYVNCGYEIKWRMILAVVIAIFTIAQWSLKKIQDFNGAWTRDLANTGATLYQLSYEATDVGSRSIVGSYVPVKDM